MKSPPNYSLCHCKISRPSSTSAKLNSETWPDWKKTSIFTGIFIAKIFFTFHACHQTPSINYSDFLVVVSVYMGGCMCFCDTQSWSVIWWVIHLKGNTIYFQDTFHDTESSLGRLQIVKQQCANTHTTWETNKNWWFRDYMNLREQCCRNYSLWNQWLLN